MLARIAPRGYLDGMNSHWILAAIMLAPGALAQQAGGVATGSGTVGTVLPQVAPGMQQKPTREPIAKEAGNGLKNMKYTLAMARTNAPHSATAQFFINTVDNEFLNFKSESPQGWGYAVFGRVTTGTEVVDAIEKVSTGRKGFHDDVPQEDVLIIKAVELA